MCILIQPCMLDADRVGFEPDNQKTMPTSEATRILYLAASNEDTGSMASQLVLDCWPDLLRTRGAAAYVSCWHFHLLLSMLLWCRLAAIFEVPMEIFSAKCTCCKMV